MAPNGRNKGGAGHRTSGGIPFFPTPPMADDTPTPTDAPTGIPDPNPTLPDASTEPAAQVASATARTAERLVRPRFTGSPRPPR